MTSHRSSVVLGSVTSTNFTETSAAAISDVLLDSIDAMKFIIALVSVGFPDAFTSL